MAHIPIDRSPAGRYRSRRATAALLAGLILATGIGVTSTIVQPSVAQAVTLGPGVWFGGDVGAGGFRHSNGTLVYCGELGRATVMGENPTMGSTSTLPAYSVGSFTIGGATFSNIQVPAMSGTALQRMNYVLSRWGQTADSTQAAAVQIAIWDLRASGASAGYQQALAHMKAGVGPGVVALAGQMIAEAQNSAAAGQAPADPRINIGSTPYVGYVLVDPGTTSLTIENAIFTQTGTNTINFNPAPSTAIQVAWQGVPPADMESWDRYYRITVTGTYRYTVTSSNVSYGRPGGSFDQGLISGVAPTVHTGSYQAVYLDPDTIWAPSLTTETPSKIVQKGQAFSETVTFNVAQDSNPWRTGITSNGERRYAPITAQGTLYGPFLSDPALNPSGEPPVGAPVAAIATVTTSATQGPGTYTVDVDEVSLETGYYSWVWNIRYADQAQTVTNPSRNDPSIPVNYFFTDGFGQVTEGHVTPMELAISTELKETAITLDDLALEDVVTPTLVDGGWLQGAGGRLPVVVRLTAYGQTGDVVRQATPPSNAEAIASTTVTVSAPRTGHDAPAMRIPLADFKRFDGGAVQACILDADQPAEYRGYVLETCDDYGAAGEIFSFTKPAVTTKAQSSGSLGELISDTAIVSNADLPAGSTIGATAYLRPVAGHLKYDSSWQPVLDANGDPVVWTQDEIDALSPEALCEVQPVGRTARVPATARGEYQLPGIRAGSEGSGVDWVEDTEIQDPETGDPVEWSRGTCGIVEEYTDLPAPKVSTQVHLPEAGLADRNFDTLIVEDLQTVSSDSLYEYEAIVDAYYTADENDQPRCDASELVWTSRPLAVTGAGRFDTESYRVGDVVPKGTTGGRLDHVEQLIRVEKSTGGREVIAVGACGAASESTIIKEKAPALPITGGQSTALAALAGVVLILLGGAAAVVQHRRRLKLSAQVRECGDEVLR